VYLDVELFSTTVRDLSFLRWLYTAISRATQRLVLISPPQELLTPESYETLADDEY